ncbi:MAG: glutamate-1-semialdehyde 2,1-aminomutase [Desulfobacterota bacterium]|jgi:glutamate-1-semialdehyde 2,1-aminomutase|nr:glutamate-1-semialdehyde 2,1-aminomutase [Thermodesulfobacteriota bacterium]
MANRIPTSENLFNRARQIMPGGVNSPVRAARAVGAVPLFISRAAGSRIYDADGNAYLDYVGSWGPLILGHAHPRVVEAIRESAGRGTSYGAPTAIEVELAEAIVSRMPAMEQVRLVNSGTEATMSALRLARGYTGRPLLVKFDGCYHGHGDSFLVKAGSGLATLGIPGSPGVPQEIATLTLSLPYNDLEAVHDLFRDQGPRIAAVIVEPIAGNMGVVLPQPGFLAGLREITARHQALLIFDEVITGFRVAPGGAQELYGLQPDLTCLGKIIGGGLPVGAYGGKKEIMAHIAPEGPVYQAGTLSGNPLAAAAGLTTLQVLGEPGVYETLEELSAYFFAGLRDLARARRLPFQVTRVGSLGSIFFSDTEVRDFASGQKASAETYARFYRAMRERGVYLAPSAFEALFISLAHTRQDLEKTLEAVEESFREMG